MLDVMVLACNPSYLEGRDLLMQVPGQPGLSSQPIKAGRGAFLSFHLSRKARMTKVQAGLGINAEPYS
jgi:hypothetical protein